MSKSFKIKSNFGPSGDQPQAIQKIVKGLKSGLLNQTLKGVTGSGKTFAMANVIENLQRPAIVMSHNKTLAAQLYGEMKTFLSHLALSHIPNHISVGSAPASSLSLAPPATCHKSIIPLKLITLLGDTKASDWSI